MPGLRQRLGTLALVVGAIAIIAPACDVPPPDPNCTVAAVGDSLTVGAGPRLGGALAMQRCTLTWWDARSGRPTREGVAVLEANRHRLPAVIVVALGTNDRWDLANFRSYVRRVMQIADGRLVVWTDMAYGPVKQHTNLVLFAEARNFPNLRLMSWDREYWANPAWRAQDGIHATPAGYQARAELTAQAVRLAVDTRDSIPK